MAPSLQWKGAVKGIDRPENGGLTLQGGDMDQEPLTEEERRSLEQGLKEAAEGKLTPWQELKEAWEEASAEAEADPVDFWDKPKEELNWFGRMLHTVRDWLFK